MASTWSPARREVSPSAISNWPLRLTEIRRAPSGSWSWSIRVPAQSASGGIRTSTISTFSLGSSSRWTRPCSGHLVLDQRHDRGGRADGRRDAEQVEVHLVARVVDARDHLLDAVALAGELADDDVVLVVAGHRDHDARGPLDAGPLEHEDLGRVPVHDDVLELVLKPLEPVAPLLDQRHLVPDTKQAASEVRADLAPACDQDVHRGQASFTGWGTSHARTASVSRSIAFEVGQTVRMPCCS